ncbi:MAG: glycoside hydrolase [Angelakisella sp.]
MNKPASKNLALFLAALMLCGSVSSLQAPAFAAATTEIEIDWNNVRQTIDGFGVTQEEECTYVMQEPARSEVMDLLYSQTGGIGLSILRTEIGCGESKPTVEPSKGVWDYTGDPRELWYFNEALARGVDKIYGTVWSPPKWMKTNNSWYNGGFLKSSCYQDYADYLAQYVKIYKQYHNINIYGVSIANEPEFAAKWKSCLWTGNMFRDFIVDYLAPTFAREGLNTNIMAGESGIWSESVVKPTLNSAAGAQALDIVTGHQYQGVVTDFATARAKGKRVWQSELCETTSPFSVSIADAVKWAKKVHSFMTIPEASAFLYWRGAHSTDSNQTLIRLDNATSYTTSQRLFALGNYSKFVRPGYVRIGATEKPNAEVYVTAYKDPTSGKFSIVLINDSDSNNYSFHLRPKNFTSGVLSTHVTDQNNSLADVEQIALQNGVFPITLGSKSVVTLTGEKDSPVPAPKPYSFVDPLNDETKLFQKTAGWMIEAGNEFGRYDNDNSCLRRSELSTQSVVYKVTGMNDFLATIYYCDDMNGIQFYTSPDGTTFTPLAAGHLNPVYTAKNWNRVKFMPQQPLPAGTNYLKVEFSGGTDPWNKHLAEMAINAGV